MRSTLLLLAALAAPCSAWELADPVAAVAPAESYILMSPHDLTHLVEGPQGVMLARTSDGLFRDVLAFSLIPAAGEYSLRGGLQIRHKGKALATWHPTPAMSCASCEDARTPARWHRAFHFSEDPGAPTALKTLESAERDPLSFDGAALAEPQTLTHLALGPDGLVARKGAAFHRVVGVHLSPSARQTASGDFAASASNMPLRANLEPARPAPVAAAKPLVAVDRRMRQEGEEVNTYTLATNGVVGAVHLRAGRPWREEWSSDELVPYLEDGVRVAEFTHERGRAGSWLKIVLTNGRTFYMRAITNDPKFSGKLLVPPELGPFDPSSIPEDQIADTLSADESGWPGAGEVLYIATRDGRLIKTTANQTKQVWMRSFPLANGVEIGGVRADGQWILVALSNGVTVRVNRKDGVVDSHRFGLDEGKFTSFLESRGFGNHASVRKNYYLDELRGYGASEDGQVALVDAYGYVLKTASFQSNAITGLRATTVKENVSRGAYSYEGSRHTVVVFLDDGKVALLDNPGEHISQQTAVERGWIKRPR